METSPLLLIGRVNLIKIVVLPKFLYLFQSLPIFLTTSFFKTIYSLIMPFIWAYKFHRISKVHIQKHVSEGGWAYRSLDTTTGHLMPEPGSSGPAFPQVPQSVKIVARSGR